MYLHLVVKPSPPELAKAIHLDQSSVSRLVRRLEAAQLTERRRARTTGEAAARGSPEAAGTCWTPPSPCTMPR